MVDDELPDPPDDLPDDLADALRAHSDDGHALREAVIYAHELLNHRHEPSTQVVPQDGEEILRVTEHDGYTEVVKRVAGQRDAYVYHVKTERHPSGEDHVRWVLIGRMEPDEE